MPESFGYLKKQYVEKVLERFSMQNSKIISTPIENHFKLSASLCPTTDEEVDDMSQVSYISAVGNLMYAMVCNRLDLSHAVNLVSKYVDNPSR